MHTCNQRFRASDNREVALEYLFNSHGHRIKVVYHELEDGGFLELKGTYTLRIRDVPLIETLQRALPEVISCMHCNHTVHARLDYQLKMHTLYKYRLPCKSCFITVEYIIEYNRI